MSAESESLPASPSVWSEAVSVAVFVIVVPAVPSSTLAAIVSVSEADAARAPSVQRPLLSA